MLITLKTILDIAESRGIAVGAFNVCTLEGIRAVVGAAEQLEQPVILQFCNAVHNKYIPMEEIGPIMLEYADRSAVPVCVHLDHGASFDEVNRALCLGFTGIMYDGSMLPYAENVSNTRAVVEAAAAYGASVEAEIGRMSSEGSENGGSAREEDYTDPEDAAAFVAATGIDALACSFGTAHGIYTKEPKLDFDRISRIRDMTDVPIVMHGGSGLSDEEFRKCIEKGVRKINYYTYAAKYAAEAVSEKMSRCQGGLFLHDISLWAVESLQSTYLETIKLFGEGGRI